MSDTKYAIVKGMFYLKDVKNKIKLFDTYQEALAVYNSDSSYKNIVKVLVEVQPVIVQSTDIIEASHLTSRLPD